MVMNILILFLCLQFITCCEKISKINNTILFSGSKIKYNKEFEKCMANNPEKIRKENSEHIENLVKGEIAFLKDIQQKIDFYFRIIGSVPRQTANKNSDFDIQIFLTKNKENCAKSIKEKIINRGYIVKRTKNETCQVYEAFTKKVNNIKIDFSIHHCEPGAYTKWNINPKIPEDMKDIIYCSNQAIKKYNSTQKVVTHCDNFPGAPHFDKIHIKQKLK